MADKTSSSSDFWLTCWYRGHIHNSGPPSRQLACCTHGRSHTRSPGVSIMRVDSWELPLSAIPFCRCFQVIFGLPGPCFPLTCMSEAVLIAPLERSTCPYQQSLLSFSKRSRSSMPSRASSSVDRMVAVSCGLTLQICLIIALSHGSAKSYLNLVSTPGSQYGWYTKWDNDMNITVRFSCSFVQGI